MRKMKKMMSLTMAAVMTLSLAGCGGGGTAPTTKAAEPAETKAETTAEAKAEETTAAQPAGEKTTITFISTLSSSFRMQTITRSSNRMISTC